MYVISIVSRNCVSGEKIFSEPLSTARSQIEHQSGVRHNQICYETVEVRESKKKLIQTIFDVFSRDP